MAELKMFDPVGSMARGLQLGSAIRQQGNQSKLAQLLGQARTAPADQRSQLMGQAYALDPAMGAAADQQFGALDEAKAKRLGQMASIFTSVDPQQRAAMWPTIRQELASMIPGAQYPDQWDESLLPQAQAIAQQLGGLKGAEPFNLGPNETRFAPDGRVIARGLPGAPKEPSWQLGQDADGNYIWLQPPSAGGMPATGAMPAPTTGGGGGVLRDSFDDVIGGLLEREGGYVADDAGAGPTRFGINSRANPDVNLASLTPQSAAEIYRERYWDAIGADSLPPQIREAAFDAAVNMGVGKARELLQQSGGDPAKFDQLRRQHYSGLAQSNPERYGQYAQGWQNRVSETGAGGRAVPAGIRGPAKAGSASFAPMAADEVRALGFPEGTVAQRNTATGAIQVLSKPAGMTPLQAASQAVKQQKAEQAQQDALATYDDSLQTLDTLIQHPGFDDLGTIEGDLKTNVPLIRTEAKGANAILETIKAQVLINTLGKLKALSATGASGFGALNQSEGDALRASIANLDTAQSHADLRRAVMRIRQVMERSRNIIAGTQVDFGRQQGPQGQRDAAPSNDIDGLLGKYGIR